MRRRKTMINLRKVKRKKAKNQNLKVRRYPHSKISIQKREAR